MGATKWVHMIFVAAGMLLIYLLVQTVDWIWGYFGTPSDLIVVGVAVVLGGSATYLTWRNKELFDKAGEIAGELALVTWPTRKETSSATIVVIIATAISALLLGFFDLIWSWATGAIYG